MNSTDQEIIEKMQSNPNVGMKLLMDTYQERLYWHIRRLVVSHDDAFLQALKLTHCLEWREDGWRFERR